MRRGRAAAATPGARHRRGRELRHRPRGAGCAQHLVGEREQQLAPAVVAEQPAEPSRPAPLLPRRRPSGGGEQLLGPRDGAGDDRVLVGHAPIEARDERCHDSVPGTAAKCELSIPMSVDVRVSLTLHGAKATSHLGGSVGGAAVRRRPHRPVGPPRFPLSGKKSLSRTGVIQVSCCASWAISSRTSSSCCRRRRHGARTRPPSSSDREAAAPPTSQRPPQLRAARPGSSGVSVTTRSADSS